MPTRSAVITKYNRIHRRASFANLPDEPVENLMSTVVATLDLFAIDNTEGSEIEKPDPAEVKEFLQKSLAPASALYNDAFFKKPIRPTVLRKDIGELYGLGEPDNSFVDEIGVETAEAVSHRLRTITWLTRIRNISAIFNRRVLDR